MNNIVFLLLKEMPLHEKAPKGSPRELRKLREKMIEKPSIINEDVLLALNTEEIPIIKVDNTEADNFIVGVSNIHSDDSHMV